MMEQTWRWFGPDDAVKLHEIRQAGASGIVTALHHIPYGVVWTKDEIAARKAMIEADTSLGLRWSVVESLPVAEPIKLADGNLSKLFDNYRDSLRNLGALGVTTVCYNFMPVLDWTRTQLATPLPGGGTALRFNAHEYAAFDCFMLARKGAEAEHAPDVLARARAWFQRRFRKRKGSAAVQHHGGLAGRLCPLRRSRPSQHAGSLRRHHRRWLARKPRALPARGGARGRGSRRTHVHPSR
jgi:mannonate dehydratase